MRRQTRAAPPANAVPPPEAATVKGVDGRYGLLCNEHPPVKASPVASKPAGTYGLLCNEAPPSDPSPKSPGEYGILCDDKPPAKPAAAPPK